MNAESPQAGLRLLAALIAADLRAGSTALAEPEEPPREEAAPRRGRKPTLVVAVAAHRLTARAA